MEDENRIGNLRRRFHQLNWEDYDRPTNRRRQNESQSDDLVQAGDHVPLELSLGSTSHSSHQIPPMSTSSLPIAPPSPFAPPITTSSLPLAPASPFAPPMTTWQTPSSIAQYITSSQYYPPPYLSNSIYQTRPSTQPMQPQFGPSFNVFSSSSFASPPTRPVMRPAASAPVSRRGYRSQSSVNRNETIPPPYPWATNRRGWIQSLENLASKQITTITGEVQCKHCEKVYQVSYNLREKFSEVESIFVMGKWVMRERAPPIWMNPEPARCELCGRDKAVKPVIAERKCKINWLFLLLGQTLGFCTLEQLKNFCKHSRSHRTGAKNRVLYLTYLGLCKMLEPNRELFQREPRR